MSSAAVPAAPQRPRPKRAKRSLLRKLADMVSPPSASPKALLPAPPLAPAAPKPPSVLDFDAELPDTELAGIARTADETTHMIAGAGGKLLKAAELFASAQEKLAGNEKFEMIGAVFGHLQGIVATVPFAGPIFTCFKTFVDFEVAAQESQGSIGDLHGRVIFVLDTMRRLDKKRSWSKDEDLAHAVLKPLKDPIRACSVLFSDYKEQSWFSRRLYGKATVDKIKDLDAGLTKAMSDATFALGLTTAGSVMPPVSTTMDPAAQEAADIVARSGGMTAFLADATNVTSLGEQLAAQLGERFDPGTMLAEVQRGFDERFDALNKSFEDVLTAVASQGKSIDEAKVMLDELSRRNSMYTQIKCAALRDLWLTAGWGARIKMPVFIDVLVDQVRVDVAQAIALSGQSAKDSYIASDLHALYEGFVEVLDGIDDDKSGTVSPQEVNEFFAFPSWRLIDYFTLVSFFMTTTRAELLKSLQHEFGLIARRLMTPTEDNQYALFFSMLRPTMAAMRDLASEQAETESTLPSWLDETPALYERSAMYKRLGKWDWKRMAKYAPASFANMHAMFAQTILLAAALEGGIDAFEWAKFEASVRGLEKYVSEWTPELADPMIKAIDAALVWHGDGTLLGETAYAKHFEFTANRPFPRTAVMKHTTRRPPNAIVGGKIGDEKLYLASTMFRDKRGESYGYATYARDVDGEISCASCAPDDVKDFSWLVTPAAHDAESTVEDPSSGILEWMDQPLADAPHPLAGVVNVEWNASPIYIARYRRDDDTILPGYLYIEDGVLHFVCSHVTSFKAETEPEDDAEADDEEEEKGDVDKKQEQQQQKRMIISTQNAKGLWFPDDTEDVVFELLDRETVTIELLISDSEQFPLNKSVSWTHPSTHYMESLTPVVIRESIAGRVHLAWCMGKSGVYLGTQVEKSEVATYLEPGPNGTSIPTKTSSFLVMTGLEREWFLSNWTLPHPELEWRQANRPGRTGGIIVQFATSAGMLSISRSKSKNPVGLDFWPPGTIAPMSMLAHRPPRHDDNTKTHLGLDMASAQGDLDALRWWLDAGLPLEYSTNAVDKASAAGFTDVLQFWKDLGKPLRYTPAAIDDAAGNGQLASLQWWLDNYGKDMKFTTATIDNAARYNRMDVILWWTERELRFKYTNDALDFASQAGFIGVLDFFAQSGHKLKVSAFGVKQASYAGHIDVLSFWRKHLSDTEFRELTATCMDSATVADSVAVLNWFRDEGVWGYTSDAMDWAAKYNNVPLLQWWFDAGVPLKYSLAAYREAGDDVKEWWASVGLDWFTLPTPTAEQLAKVAPPEEEEIEALNPFDDGADDVSVLSLDSADVFKFQLDLTCRAGNVEAVKKWFESGDHTQYSEDALDYASYNESPAIVEMWFNSGLPLRYTHRTLNIASQEGHIEILRAWKASGNELLYTSYAMDSASASGHLHVLHWWMLSGLELLYTEAAMDRASGGDHLKVLEWWTRSGLPVMYSENALLLASANGCIQALTWWHESYFQLKYDRVACAVAATEGTHEKVLKWWHEYDEEPFPSDPIDAAILADNQYMVQWWLTRGNCAKWTATDMSDEVRAILDRYEDGTLSEIGSIHSEDDGEYERWQAANQLQADAAEEESDSGDESDGEYARWMAETKLAVAAMEAAGDGDSDEEDGDDDDKDDEDEAEAEEGQIELIVVGQETASKDVGVPLDEKFDAALAGVALAVEVLEQ